MKVKRIDHAQSAMQTDEAQLKEDELGLDRATYKKLSSLTDNKVIVTPDGPNSPYDRFLLDMNKIHNKEEVPADFIELDRYLGTLGFENEYPFMEDTYHVDLWFPIEEWGGIRQVFDTEEDWIVDRATETDVWHDSTRL